MRTEANHNQLPVELYKIRPARWLLDLLCDWAMIICLFVIFNHLQSWYLLPIFALLIGARQHALGLLVHDSTHLTAFRSRKLNDFFGHLFVAWPLCLDLKDGYRPWHFEHHKHLGDCKNPELVYRGMVEYERSVTWPRIVLMFAMDMLGLGIFDLYSFLKAVFPYRNPRRYLGPVLLWSTFAAVTCFFGHGWIFGLWTWSLVTGFWAVFRVRMWAEHAAVFEKNEEETHRFSAGPIARFVFFPHNTHHHYEHHRAPQVPYYNLPKLRGLAIFHRPILPLGRIFPWKAPQAGKVIESAGVPGHLSSTVSSS